MMRGMFAPAVAGSIVERRRRRPAAERPIVSNIGPDALRHRLALGKDRHRGVVPVQALSSEDMGLDQRVKGLQNRDAGTDLVGEGRDAEIDALPGIAFALAVQGLMLPELLEQDGREQVRPGKSARRNMEGCRRLRDRLAVPTRESLAHGLDDLPAAPDHLQRLGDVLAELRQPGGSAAGTGLRRGDDDALARQVLRKGLPRGPLTLERSTRLGRCPPRRQFVLGRCRFEIVECSSICSRRRALRSERLP